MKRKNLLYPVLRLPKVFLILLALPPACDLIELPGPEGISFFPQKNGVVLEEGESAWVSFDFPVDRSSAEDLFTVRDYGGPLAGSLHWEGRTLIFQPEKNYLAGRRYLFTFSGVFRDQRGALREYHHGASFYFRLIRHEAGGLLGVFPPAGSLLSQTSPIRLEFSLPMDRTSFLKGLTVDPKTSLLMDWDSEDRILQISPEKEWKNHSPLSLNLGEELSDQEGFPLPPQSPILYFIQGDTEAPRLLSVEAALNDPEALFPPLGEDLSHCLAFKDALRLSFSKAMKEEETRNAVSLTPEHPGTWHWLDDKTLIFRPQIGYQAGQTYVLGLNSLAEDRDGNPLHPFPPLSFVPRIDFLSAVLELSGEDETIADQDFSASLPLHIDPAPPTWTDYTFILHFQGGFFDTPEEKIAAQKGISLTSLFPPYLPDPHPMGWSWSAPNRVSFTFSGFQASSPGEAHYYRLQLRGGPAGIRTGEGNIFPHSREQLLVTQEEE